MSNTVMRLHQRNCILRDADHRYIWDPEGIAEEMAISVTGVTSFGKPPVDYSAYPEAAPRGNHVHRAMEALALNQIETSVCQKAEAEGDENAWEAGPEAWCRFMHEQGTTSPEGIDCTKWIDQLAGMSFWGQCHTIACEYTLVHRRKSLGGQLDLLCLYKDRVILCDLKTKSASWSGPSKDDIAAYKAQAGGYLYLLSDGDDAHGGCLVDECRTLIVTPNQCKWLPPYDPDDCYEAWETCWDKYSASAALNPF
jgi:ATP-dependent exoDNAse (exonuclease V) beta subunit